LRFLLPNAKLAHVAKDAALATALSAALIEIEKISGKDRKAVAAELGVDVSTVGRWATGERSVPIEMLPAIDSLCGKRKGYVLRLAGYVDDDLSIEDAIESAPELTETGRSTVLSYYRFVRDDYDENRPRR
jgi:hypothetical protein